MARRPDTKSSLNQLQKDVIAHAIAEKFLRENFRLMADGEYRRRLGQTAKELGYAISAEELHEFILDKLPKAIGKMFGWTECGITGSAKS